MNDASRPHVGIAMRAFHVRMADARARAGLTQAQLGTLTGIKTQAISLIERFGHRPTRDQQEEIAAALDVPRSELFPPEIMDLYGGGPSSVRFTMPADRLGSLLTSIDAEPIQLLTGGLLHDELERLVDSLPVSRERDVIRRRFGLDGTDGLTLEATAKARGRGETRERIRQIEAKALRRLRAPFRALPLRLYIEDDTPPRPTYPELPSVAASLAATRPPPPPTRLVRLGTAFGSPAIRIPYGIPHCPQCDSRQDGVAFVVPARYGDVDPTPDTPLDEVFAGEATLTIRHWCDAGHSWDIVYPILRDDDAQEAGQ